MPPSASWAGKTLREPQLKRVLHARCCSLPQHFYDFGLYHLSRWNCFLPLNSMNWSTNQLLLLYLRGSLVLFLEGSVTQYQKLCCQKVLYFKHKLGQELISCFQTLLSIQSKFRWQSSQNPNTLQLLHTTWWHLSNPTTISTSLPKKLRGTNSWVHHSKLNNASSEAVAVLGQSSETVPSLICQNTPFA